MIPGLGTRSHMLHSAAKMLKKKKKKKKERERKREDMNSQFVALFWLLTFTKPNAQSQVKERFVYGSPASRKQASRCPWIRLGAVPVTTDAVLGVGFLLIIVIIFLACLLGSLWVINL